MDKPHNNLKVIYSRRLREVFTVILLVLSLTDLILSPLVLSTPGDNVSLRLTTTICCLLAMATTDMRALRLLALVCGVIAVILALHDHSLGMRYSYREGHNDALIMIDTQSGSGAATKTSVQRSH
jgi:hypothetical protein